MILAYKILTYILYPFLFLFLYIRKINNKEDPVRYKEKILISHFRIVKKNDCKLIWFHAASIGEFKSILPIIKKLNDENKNLKFLITTTTLSSGNIASIELENYNNVEHRYFPFDVAFLINKFLLLWKPDTIFLVDSEIWPNLILSAHNHKIPVAIINARLTSSSFKKWKSFPNIAKKIFEKISLFICSNLETKNYLNEFKLKNIYYNGNIKFINQIEMNKIKDINENFLSNNRFWFAASVHKEEDIFCLKTHIKLKKKFKDVITIIAPRHIERTEEIYNLSKKLNLNAQVLNKNQLIMREKEIIIINYFGALQNYFKYSKSVFIGKSMIKKLKNNSGQNPLEAAKLNCKIYHGPYVYNFEEIYKILEIKKISKKIENDHELSENLIIDLEDKTKGQFQISKTIMNFEQQIMSETMKLVNNFLLNENK
jgi:3-deoxy-D-manno-octulosonic-acid transferase